MKRAVVEKLATSGLKVAIRYPADHKALFDGDRSVTIHNDCIFNGGPDGDDGGTFPADDRQTWIDYTKQVAGGNTYGGEGCNQAGDSSYDWSNFDDVCGSNGLASYVNEFQISYFNVCARSTCHDKGNTDHSCSQEILHRSRSSSMIRIMPIASIQSNLRFEVTSERKMHDVLGVNRGELKSRNDIGSCRRVVNLLAIHGLKTGVNPHSLYPVN